MSARKLGTSNSLQAQQNVTVEARQAKLSLSPESVVIHKGGIEFRSLMPFARWVEMTVSLQSPQDGGTVRCSGVVVDCSGNKHAGYHVSMIFTGLTKQAAARLSTLAGTQLG
jgi:hypothetical protein